MVTFLALRSEDVEAIRRGGPDANGQPAERAISDGQGKPCRHCLRRIPDGAGMLVLAWRPFAALQPYAEAGPIFLCEDQCQRFEGPGVPEILASSPDYLVKAYSKEERIVYGTGQITPVDEIGGYAETLLARDGVAFVDVRSARNNCFLSRVVRDQDFGRETAQQ